MEGDAARECRTSHGPRGCTELAGGLGPDESTYTPAVWHLYEEAVPVQMPIHCALVAGACGRAKRASGVEEPMVENELDDAWPTLAIDQLRHAGAQETVTLVSKHRFPQWAELRRWPEVTQRLIAAGCPSMS